MTTMPLLGGTVMKLFTSATLLAGIFCATHALAGDEVKATEKSTVCRSYLFGMLHIEATGADVHARQAVQTHVTDKLRRECQAKNGTLELSDLGVTCGHPQDKGPITPFQGQVCVTCEATAFGVCR